MKMREKRPCLSLERAGGFLGGLALALVISFSPLDQLRSQEEPEEQPVPTQAPGPIPESVQQEWQAIKTAEAQAQNRPAPANQKQKAGPSPVKERVARLGVAVRVLAGPELLGMAEAHAPGLRVDYVVPGGPAEKAGIRAQDLLTHFNDQLLFAPVQLEKLVKRSAIGSAVRLTSRTTRPPLENPRIVEAILDAAPTSKALSPSSIPSNEFRVTGRTVRVFTGETTLALSTRQEKAYLVISTANQIRFEGEVQTVDDIPAELVPKIHPVASLRSGRWEFKLPLPQPILPPKQLDANEGPKAPAPVND